MEFYQKILEELSGEIEKLDMVPLEYSKNSVIYSNNVLTFRLFHNDMENSNGFWLGVVNSRDVEIDDDILENYYHSGLRISNLGQNEFIGIVKLFLAHHGMKTIQKGVDEFRSLESYNKKRSEKYTLEILNEQNLQAAQRAWLSGNYHDVVRHLNKCDLSLVSNSWKKKYELAKRKIKM